MRYLINATGILMLLMSIYSCASTQHYENNTPGINIIFNNEGPDVMQSAVFATHYFSYCIGDMIPGEEIELRVKPKYKTKFRPVRVDYYDAGENKQTMFFGMYLGAQNYGEVDLIFEDGKIKKAIDNTKRVNDKTQHNKSL